MEIIDKGNETLLRSEHFDAEQTLKCGQVFRFGELGDGSFILRVGARGIVLSRRGDSTVALSCGAEEFDGFWRGYFDIDTDYGAIWGKLTKDDDVMTRARETGRGIRILRQQPWECLISFLLSPQANIPKIQKAIERICNRFGTETDCGFHAFPTVETLASATVDDLMACGAGFHAKPIIHAARLVAEGKLLLDSLTGLPHETITAALKTVNGVGDKVADCVALFSYGKVEAFPVDVHVERVMKLLYPVGENAKVDEVRSYGMARFGGNAGYAQQFLFNYIRNGKAQEKANGSNSASA